MRKEKATNLKTEIMDKCLHIKYGIIWAYCAAQDKPMTLKDIGKHFKIGHLTVWKTMKELIKIGAMEALPRQKEELFTLYQAKKDTYYPSELIYD
jgi:predicted DNA-binding transcriptional regulator